MNDILDTVRRLKNGEAAAFTELYERFRPLIIAWMKQTKELYQQNREDFESMAKVILYESAQKYDEARGVPFESFYKINLYHWYGNYKRKKRYKEVELTEAAEQMNESIQESLVEMKEKKIMLNNALSQLSSMEYNIILRIMQGFTEQQIADEYSLSKKTIQNKKYVAMAKMKEFICDNFQ